MVLLCVCAGGTGRSQHSARSPPCPRSRGEREVDDLPPGARVELQRPVVVACIQRPQPLARRQGVEQRLAEARRHDVVVAGQHHRHRPREGAQVRRAVVAVAQQPAHRQPRVVVRSHVLQPVPRRDQHQPRHLLVLACRGRGRHAGAQRLAQHQQRRAELAVGDGNAARRIVDQRGLAEWAVARPVTRVLGQQHAQAQRRQRVHVERALPGMPGVAVKDDDGAARALRRRRQQAAELLRIRPGLQAGGAGLLHADARRVVQQPVLHQRWCSEGQHRHQAQRRCRRSATHHTDRVKPPSMRMFWPVT